MNLPENICGKVRGRVWPGARSSPRWAGPKPRGGRARRAWGGYQRAHKGHVLPHGQQGRDRGAGKGKPQLLQ